MNANLRFTLALILVVGQCSCQSPKPQTTSTVSERPNSAVSVLPDAAGTNTVPDPLVSLNGLFLDAYRERQATVRTNIRPLIVANVSTLVLYWHGVSETNRCIPDVYHALKAVAHVPFGIFLRVDPCATEGDAPVPDSVLQELNVYRSQIETAESSLSAAGFSETQLARQEQILNTSLAYLTNVIARAKAPRSSLMSFARALGPLMLENANDAAAAQLDMTHGAVMKWKARIPAEDWKQLVVVVRGPQMPRRMNILSQYFAKVLGEPSHNLGYPLESRRLIYAEFIPNGRDHLDLMATTFIDGDASETFFGNRWRMGRDVLADGAEEYLKHLSLGPK